MSMDLFKNQARKGIINQAGDTIVSVQKNYKWLIMLWTGDTA